MDMRTFFETVTWLGDHPYALMVMLPDNSWVLIDLDESGWLKTHENILRAPGTWLLFPKDFGCKPRLTLRVHPGDQPYYTSRHVGITGSGGSNEVVAFGIGKKQADGTMVRLWAMPDGSVCGGDDVEPLGIDEVRRRGPR